MPISPISSAFLDLGGTSQVSQASERMKVETAKAQTGGKDAYVEFEAFVLQSFVEAMLPKDAESVFGSGTAGSYWKSMLAEKLGMELAKSGGIGIAATLEKSRSAPGPDKP